MGDNPRNKYKHLSSGHKPANYGRQKNPSGRRSSGGSYGGSRGGGGFHSNDFYKATCHECGDACEVPFKPNGRKPVLCSICHRQQQVGGGSHNGYRGGSDDRHFGGRGFDRRDDSGRRDTRRDSRWDSGRNDFGRDSYRNDRRDHRNDRYDNRNDRRSFDRNVDKRETAPQTDPMIFRKLDSLKSKIDRATAIFLELAEIEEKPVIYNEATNYRPEAFSIQDEVDALLKEVDAEVEELS